jgi:CHAD domain-containing protein
MRGWLARRVRSELKRLLGTMIARSVQCREPAAGFPQETSHFFSMPSHTDKALPLFNKVSRAIDKIASKPTPDNVHGFRTATRRLETVLQTFSPDHHRKLLKQLGRWRRRAGTLRDLDVQINALRNLKILEEPGRKSQLMGALLDARAKRERKLLKSFHQDGQRQLHKRLKKAAGELALPGKNSPEPLELARRTFAELARDHATMTEASLHEYRLRCKRIRYLAEFSERKEAKAFITELVRIQDVTGDWRDWQVLTASAEDQFRDTPRSALLAALRNVTHAKFQEAARICAQVRDVLLGAQAQPSATTKDAAAPPRKTAKSAQARTAVAATA